MGSKYVDTASIMQVIGCVFNNPKILDITDKYSIVDEDFSDPFHKTIFGAIYKIYELGAQKITLESISDFLSSRPKSAAVYKQGKGEEWLMKISEISTPSTFD
jgi:replicative DNA helicase